MRLSMLTLLLTACSISKYVRPTTDDKVESTPEAIERGEYLVNGIAACGTCHNAYEDDSFDNFTEVVGLLGGGAELVEYKEGTDKVAARLYMPNISMHTATGVGGWTDDELRRAIRDGIDKDGEVIFPMMPYGSYQHMSDADVDAIIAYMRTVPAYEQDNPPFEPEIPAMFKMVLNAGVTLHEPVESVPEPDRADPVAYGEYLGHLGHCADCHASTKTGVREPGDPEYMAGGDRPFVMEYGTFYAPNLTPHETGIGGVSDAQLKTMLRTATTQKGHPMAPPMNLLAIYYRNLTDQDLDALVAWLRSLPPVDKDLPEPIWTPKGEMVAERTVAFFEGLEKERLAAEQGAWAEAVVSATRKHIEELTTEEVVVLEDAETGEEVSLILKEVHETIKHMPDKGHTACAVFAAVDDEEALYDVDFWVADEGEATVHGYTFHKVPELEGKDWIQKERYTFVNEAENEASSE